MRSMRASDKGDREPQSAIEFEAQLIARLQALVGPTTAELRNLRREFSRRLAKAPDALVLELALRLLARQQFSLRFLSYELVQHHKQAMQSLNATRLQLLGKGLDSWGA